MKPYRHLWVVDLLSSGRQRVLAVGDHNLTNAVASFGFETIAATDPDSCDVLLLSQSLDVGCGPDGSLLRPEASIVAVHFPTNSRLFDFGLPGRVAVLALAPLIERRIAGRVDAARARLEAMGYRCRTIRIGNGHGPSELISGPNAHPVLRDRPSGTVLVGERPPSPPPPAGGDDAPVTITRSTATRSTVTGTTAARTTATGSLVDAVRRAVEARLDRHLDVDRVMMMSSQKVQLHVSDRDSTSSFVISVGVGASIDLLERSLESRSILGGRNLPESLRTRVVWPVADGSAGPARFVVEPVAPGSPVSKLSSRIVRNDCIDFMRRLFVAGADGSTTDDDVFRHRAESWCRGVSPFLEPSEVRTLSALHERVADGLGGLPLGFTHGDFWPGNIFMSNGRLSAVLDWDDSSPHGLPFTDAFDFAATTAPTRDNTDPGPRVVKWLWPMIQEPRREIGGLRAEDLELPVEMTPELLRSLVVAFWLERISRQLTFGHRRSDRRWLDANLVGPLRFLGRELL